MKKIIVILFVLFFFNSTAWGFWIWSPKTNKWVNPKYATKDNPKKQLTYALEFYNSDKYKEAMREFNKLINKFPKAYEASEAQFFLGRCWEKQDKFYEAFIAYQKVIDKYPFSERTADILDRQYAIGERYLEKPSTFWQSFSGQENPAVEIFRKVVSNAPYSAYADKAQYKIGLILKDLERFDEAKEEFAKLIDEYPKSEWVKGAKYQIALIDAQMAPEPEYGQDSTDDAVKGFEEFVKQYPDAKLSQEAQEHIRNLKSKEAKKNFDIARFYEKQQSLESAKIYYRYVFENYPESAWAQEALEQYKVLEKE